MKDIKPTFPHKLFNLSLSYSCKPNIWFSLICDVKRPPTTMSEKICPYHIEVELVLSHLIY